MKKHNNNSNSIPGKDKEEEDKIVLSELEIEEDENDFVSPEYADVYSRVARRPKIRPQIKIDHEKIDRQRWPVGFSLSDGTILDLEEEDPIGLLEDELDNFFDFDEETGEIIKKSDYKYKYYLLIFFSYIDWWLDFLVIFLNFLKEVFEEEKLSWKSDYISFQKNWKKLLEEPFFLCFIHSFYLEVWGLLELKFSENFISLKTFFNKNYVVWAYRLVFYWSGFFLVYFGVKICYLLFLISLQIVVAFIVGFCFWVVLPLVDDDPDSFFYLLTFYSKYFSWLVSLLVFFMNFPQWFKKICLAFFTKAFWREVIRVTVGFLIKIIVRIINYILWKLWVLFVYLRWLARRTFWKIYYLRETFTRYYVFYKNFKWHWFEDSFDTMVNRQELFYVIFFNIRTVWRHYKLRLKRLFRRKLLFYFFRKRFYFSIAYSSLKVFFLNNKYFCLFYWIKFKFYFKKYFHFFFWFFGFLLVRIFFFSLRLIFFIIYFSLIILFFLFFSLFIFYFVLYLLLMLA
jgi:hypothetical protein